MSREQPKGVLCPDCGDRFKDFVEFAKHIIDNKATHPGDDRLRKAEKWLEMDRRFKKLKLTEKGHLKVKSNEVGVIANIKKAYRDAEARGDTKKMQELERLVEVVEPDGVKQ